jgi:superfamily II DNA/RNA helicase
VHREFVKYNQWGLRVVLLTGNKDYDAERRELFPPNQGGNVCVADVVIATPGRLLDHLLDDRRLPLDQLRCVVVGCAAEDGWVSGIWWLTKPIA